MKKPILLFVLLLAVSSALADKWAVKVTAQIRREDNNARSAAAEAGYRIQPLPEYYTADNSRNGRRAEFATEAEARAFLVKMYNDTKRQPGSLFQSCTSPNQVGEVVCIERSQPAREQGGGNEGGTPHPPAPDPREILPESGPANFGMIPSVNSVPESKEEGQLPKVPKELPASMGGITVKVIDGQKITVSNPTDKRLYFIYEYTETNLKGEKTTRQTSNEVYKYTDNETIYMNHTNLDKRVITGIRIIEVSERVF